MRDLVLNRGFQAGLSEKVPFEPRLDDLAVGWRIECGEASGSREARKRLLQQSR